MFDAITLYDLGYSLDDAADKMQSRRGYKIGRSTSAAWLEDHRKLTTYARLRAEGRRLFKPSQVIRSIKLYHRQIYKYAFHRAKLAILRENRQHRRFAGVADFLERVLADCPNELFGDSERASQTPLVKVETSRLIVVNDVSEMALLSHIPCPEPFLPLTR